VVLDDREVEEPVFSTGEDGQLRAKRPHARGILSGREQFEKDKLGLQKALGHDIDGGRVEQWEQDKRAVLKALGHDENGKCPAGVDWRNDIRTVPEELKDANSTARTRAGCHFPLAHRLSNCRPASVAACGWWWCSQKKPLTSQQWTDLHAALEDLRAKGIDPNGAGVAYHAGVYATLKSHKAAWGAYAQTAKFIDEAPQAAEKLFKDDYEEIQREVAKYKWVASPREGKRNPKDKATWLFLNSVRSAGGKSAVAAAIAFLFGLGQDGEDYSTLKNRMAVASTRRE
jgi:hypothetical protein